MVDLRLLGLSKQSVGTESPHPFTQCGRFKSGTAGFHTHSSSAILIPPFNLS